MKQDPQVVVAKGCGVLLLAAPFLGLQEIVKRRFGGPGGRRGKPGSPDP